MCSTEFPFWKESLPCVVYDLEWGLTVFRIWWRQSVIWRTEGEESKRMYKCVNIRNIHKYSVFKYDVLALLGLITVITVVSERKALAGGHFFLTGGGREFTLWLKTLDFEAAQGKGSVSRCQQEIVDSLKNSEKCFLGVIYSWDPAMGDWRTDLLLKGVGLLKYH